MCAANRTVSLAVEQLTMAVKLSLLLALCLFAAAVSAKPLEDEPTLPPAPPAPVEPSTTPPAPVEPSTPAPVEPSTLPPAPVEPSTPAEEPSTPPPAPVEPSTPADGPTDTPYTKPTEIPDGIPKSCAERPVANDYLMIPDPATCTGFIVCKGAETWNMDCPSGTYFSYALQRCDWPWNVSCVEPEPDM